MTKKLIDEFGKYVPSHYLLNVNDFGAVQVSDYSEEKGYVDYQTLSECIRYIFNFECISRIPDWWYNNTESDDIYDWCLVDDNAYDFLKKNHEAVAYSPSTHLYLWGIPCIGKSWALELTQISFDNEQVTEI